jgi:DNA mismatch repair protein MutS
MFLDSATLQDLEIVPTPLTRGTTLWSLVDRTRTRVGREVLRERLLAPPHAADQILALQRAHQVLAAEASAYRTTLDRADSDGVEGYLRLNWQLPSDMPAAIRFRKWSRQYLQNVEQGQTSVTVFLEAAAHLRGRLAVADATVLTDLGEQIAALLETPDARELRRLASRQSLAAKCAFDQLARETAQPLLASLLLCVGRVEALWSLGVATLEHGWTYPQPSSQLRAVGLVHPFLGPRAVPNDLHLDEQVRVCFVTGPNMAGKSTFLKAVAIAVLLAHAGCGVPAVSMEFRTVGTVFSSVHVVDNLSAGESFYLAEVRRIAALAVALSDHGSAVAVVDEPFRGTNVHDAAEATLAVITRLAAHPAALVLVASHVGEVVPAILDDPRIALFQFAADVTAEQPRFDYRLRAGVSAQRLGMTLLRQERVLDLLEHSAKTADVQHNDALEPTARGH